MYFIFFARETRKIAIWGQANGYVLKQAHELFVIMITL